MSESPTSRTPTAGKKAFVRPDTLTEKLLVSFKWCLIVLALLVLAWAALAATKWLPRTTEVQHKALAILDQPPKLATGRHNAFAAIWLWQYDIPGAELENVANADLARIRASFHDSKPSFESSAQGRYSKQDLSYELTQVLCASDEDDCLAKVRAQLDPTRRILTEHAVLLGNARKLTDFDYYHDLLPRNPGNPMPQLGGMGMLLLSDAAIRFVDGNKPEGLERACTEALAWRGLSQHADSRVVQSVSSKYYIASIGLVAGMRAELAADTPLPESCQGALALLEDSAVRTCDVMKVEFAKNAMQLRHLGDPLDSHAELAKQSRWSQMLGSLLINGDAAVAYSAPPYASYCSGDVDIQREATRLDAVALWATCGVQQTLFDPIGCSLADLSNPRLRSPLLQFQDMQRMNVLVRTALARDLAKSSERESGSKPAAGLPAGVTLDTRNQQLRVRRAFSFEGESSDFAVPLPASRLQ